MTNAFDIVRAGYDEIGTRYRDWSSDATVRQRWIGRLLATLPPQALVVDLGCGSGGPAAELGSHGHQVLGFDASTVQLRLAQRAAPEALLVQADITKVSLHPASVDAVASFYALGHIPSDRHSSLFASIADWLRPGGLLLTSAPVRAGDNAMPSWLGVPMFFGGIGEFATRRAVNTAGLVLETFDVVEEDEGDGHRVPFIWLIARKPKQT